MLVEFTKMNGAGNDFVLIDNRERDLIFSEKEISRLCHRQRGIGADGLILLENCKNGKADYAWKFYNSDGSQAEMCGNGSRCFAKFVQLLTQKTVPFSFETLAGIIHAEFVNNLVKVSLTQPIDLSIGTNLSWEDQSGEVHSINTGVPHAIHFVKDINSIPVKLWGAALRYHKHFEPRGTNVNFVQLMPDQSIRVRTYERGVEDETLACGTGVTASALITARVFNLSSPIKVLTQGGDILQVGFQWDETRFYNVNLTGPAEVCFTGRIEI